MPARVLEVLKIMVGETEASDVVHAATGKDGDPEELVRQYLDRTFFKLHIQQYRKRPVYWLLQSPKKKYGVWVFHERLNKDSLFRIQTEYAEPKINHLEAQLADLRKKRDQSKGREQRDI